MTCFLISNVARVTIYSDTRATSQNPGTTDLVGNTIFIMFILLFLKYMRYMLCHYFRAVQLASATHTQGQIRTTLQTHTTSVTTRFILYCVRGTAFVVYVAAEEVHT